MKTLRGDRNQCPTCHEYFNSGSAFTKHRVGDFPQRRCLTPNEMQSKGMSLNPKGFWIGSEMPTLIVTHHIDQKLQCK